jgi:hypothetical protein
MRAHGIIHVEVIFTGVHDFPFVHEEPKALAFKTLI